MKTIKANIEFGCIDLETDERRIGYIDKNGKMQYKRLPWYKRIFNKPKRPEKTETIGTSKMVMTNYKTGVKIYKTVPVYRIFNPHTNTTYRVYTVTDDADGYKTEYNFNVDLWKINGSLVRDWR